MCYNCGCQNPDDDMGDPKNITNATLRHLSKHWGKSFEDTQKTLLQILESNSQDLETDEHLKEMFASSAKVWGQSIDQAKKNTLELLKKEVR